MSFPTPSTRASIYNTPSKTATPNVPPEEDITGEDHVAAALDQLEQPRVQGSDSDTPNRPSDIQNGSRPRPGSRMHSQYPNRRSIVGRSSYDTEGPRRPSSGKSQRPLFRDEWDYDTAPEMRDYPTPKEYERYWYSDYRPDWFISRRPPRPPPSRFNKLHQAGAGSSSDDDIYYNKIHSGEEPIETTERRRGPDEEMGLRPASTLRRDNPNQQQPWGFDWDNLTAKEKAEVLRLPLTQWMNSTFKNHFVASLGEFVGTTMFLFFAFAGTEVANIRSEDTTDSNTTTGESTGFNVATLLYISLCFGFSLMVNVWVFFRISGGLFNPAVTFAMVVVRAISLARAACLFTAQIAGAICASAMVRYLFPEGFNVRTTLGGGASQVQGIFIEAILTAELVFTILMLAKEKHRATFIAPVGIGLALFISELVGVQFTGGSLNPARSFGPCVISGEFDSEHWIYWVGPIIGSIIAVAFYRFIKTLEYEMANPGADGDDLNDPTKNPEKRAEILGARENSKEPSPSVMNSQYHSS